MNSKKLVALVSAMAAVVPMAICSNAAIAAYPENPLS